MHYIIFILEEKLEIQLDALNIYIKTTDPFVLCGYYDEIMQSKIKYPPHSLYFNVKVITALD